MLIYFYSVLFRAIASRNRRETARYGGADDTERHTRRRYWDGGFSPGCYNDST